MSEQPLEIPIEQEAIIPAWADVAARREKKEWSDLDGVKQTNNRWWLRVYGIILVLATVILFLLFMISLIFWSWHYLAPENLHWLSEGQLQKIQSVLFSGGMGAILSSIVQKQIGKS